MTIVVTDADKEPDDNEILEELERRALMDDSLEAEDARAEEESAAYDVIRLAGGETSNGIAADLTLGGYIELHNRVPAFEGSDGQPYTVDVEVEPEEGETDAFVAYLVFLRWAATGAGIMDHLETGDVAAGRSEDEARAAAMELSLYEVKAALEAAIDRKRAERED